MWTDRQTIRPEKVTWSKCFCRLSLMKCQLWLISKSLEIGMYDLIFQNVKNLISTVPLQKNIKTMIWLTCNILHIFETTKLVSHWNFFAHGIFDFISQRTNCSNHELFDLHLLNGSLSFCQTHSNYSNYELFDLTGKCGIIGLQMCVQLFYHINKFFLSWIIWLLIVFDILFNLNYSHHELFELARLCCIIYLQINYLTYQVSFA